MFQYFYMDFVRQSAWACVGELVFVIGNIFVLCLRCISCLCVSLIVADGGEKGIGRPLFQFI